MGTLGVSAIAYSPKQCWVSTPGSCTQTSIQLTNRPSRTALRCVCHGRHGATRRGMQPFWPWPWRGTLGEHFDNAATASARASRSGFMECAYFRLEAAEPQLWVEVPRPSGAHFGRRELHELC